MVFQFHDRLGNIEPLKFRPGETVSQCLLYHFIPPASVLVTCQGVPVADTHYIDEELDYEVSLIEGYDIRSIRNLLSSAPHTENAVYLKQRLLFSETGKLELEQQPFTEADLAEFVERTVEETLSQFDLIQPDETITIGLSGGVDSSSLLVLLAYFQQQQRFRFSLVAATFDDFDSKRSPTFEHAHQLAERWGIAHHIVPATLAQSIFHLKRPVNQVLLSLMETADAHQVMYIDHHTTRRTLEVFANSCGSHKIALGLHITDLLGGLLNAQATGYQVGMIPRRHLNNVEYIYPLAFVAKKELHLYHRLRTGKLALHTPPNQWELNPKDRNFYYYMADFLQTIWPGIEAWMFTGHNYLARTKQPVPALETCGNCGASIALQEDTIWEPGSFCDVCNLLAQYDWLETN